MALFRNMTNTQQFAVLSKLDIKLTGIMEGRVKLRDRRNEVILSAEEDFEIETALLRFDQMASDIVKYKRALMSCEDDLKPPSSGELQAMRTRVARISQINVTNNTASAIIAFTTDAVGEIPKVT